MYAAPRRLLVLIAALNLALPACTAMAPDEAGAIINRHVAARGGAAALDAIDNLDTRVLIEETTFTVEGDYRATAGGMMRVDIFADGKRVFSEGLDSGGAWNWSGGDIEPSTEKGEEALRNGVEFNLFGLHRFAERGHRIELDGEEVIDGVTYKVLKITLANGFETWLFVNAENSMIERRRDVRALHPDVNAEERQIESVYSDFTDYCGVLSPRKTQQIDMKSGETVQTTTIIDQTCNLPEADLRIDRNAE